MYHFENMMNIDEYMRQRFIFVSSCLIFLYVELTSG